MGPLASWLRAICARDHLRYGFDHGYYLELTDLKQQTIHSGGDLPDTINSVGLRAVGKPNAKSKRKRKYRACLWRSRCDLLEVGENQLVLALGGPARGRKFG